MIVIRITLNYDGRLKVFRQLKKLNVKNFLEQPATIKWPLVTIRICRSNRKTVRGLKHKGMIVDGINPKVDND